MLAVLLLLSGCVGPNGTTEPGKTTEPGQTTEQPSSEQGTDTPSEVIIRTLADQQSEWTEGQFYPGAYTQEKTTFSFPSGSTTQPLETNGIVYAYGTRQNADKTGMEHVIGKTDGTKEEDISLAEIPENYRLYQMYGAADTLYLLARENEATPDVQNLELFIYSTAGEFRLRKKLTELLNSADTQNSLIGAFADQDGNLWAYLPEEKTLTCIGPDGKTSRTVELPKDSEYGYMRGRAADELTITLKTENGLLLGKLNTNTGTSEVQMIDGLPGVKTILPGTTYDALITTEKSVYGVTLQNGAIVKELLAFEDLGIDQSILKNVEDHEDGSISMLLLARGKTEGERIVLTPSLAKVRNGLTLACLKNTEYLNDAVGLYNQAHPDDKIKIKEYYDKYAVDASETDALNRLNSDLMDGTAGDIICLDGISFAGGGKALLDKGIFVDLYELMDEDPDFHKEDYFAEVWRANETGGKLYRLVPFFSLNTRCGRVDEVGETTHIDESLLFETEPVTNLFGPLYRRPEFIHDLLVFSLGDFRDRKAVLYDTDQMARYIEVAGRMPDFAWYGDLGEETGQYQDYNNAVNQLYHDLADHLIRFEYNRARENTCFGFLRHASAALGEAHDQKEHIGEDLSAFFRNVGTKVTYSGFPVKEGCGSAVIDRLTLAIPVGTEAPEEAWGFLKSTLAEDYQSIKRLSGDAIPVSRKVFQENVEHLMEYTRENDPYYAAGFGGNNPETGWNVSFWIPATQQWMVDAFMNLLPNITLVDEVDANVEAIVTEEIEKYCDGRQTAEEAARNIVERVELYRDEQ